MNTAQDDNAQLAHAMARLSSSVPTDLGLATTNQVSAPTGPSGRPEVVGGKAGLAMEAGEDTAAIETIPESPEISPELSEHIEIVQRGEVQLPGPIDVGTWEGQPLSVQPATPQLPNIVLPMTKSDFATGQKQPILSSWRWLYEWVKRIILMKPGGTVYRS